MRTEFRKAIQPKEARALSAFDRRVFTSDNFTPSDWKEYEVWWMLVNGRRIGCCAFQRHADFCDGDSDGGGLREGSLYIGSTGILPQFRSMGFGRLFKAWQISYAATHGFNRIVTNVRKRNKAIIALNKKFGFRAIKTVPNYYVDPPDATVVMERAIDRLPADSPFQAERTAHSRSPNPLASYRKAFAGVSEEALAIWDGIVPDRPAAGER